MPETWGGHFQLWYDDGKAGNNICKSAVANLRNVADVRQSLTQEAAEKRVHALVTSRLDSNNAMLYGLPGVLPDRIQRVQNTAARVICHSNEFSTCFHFKEAALAPCAPEN